MKYVLLSIVICLSVFGAKAQDSTVDSGVSLRNVYTELSQLPNVESEAPLDALSLDVAGNVMHDIQRFVMSGLDRTRARESMSEAYSILRTLKMNYIINGGINQYAFGLVYANELSPEQYEVLIVAGSENFGLLAIYGITNQETITTIQNAPLYMHESRINIPLGDIPDKGPIYLINIGY